MSTLDLNSDRMVHTDNSRLVGLTSPEARVILALYVFCNVVFMVSTLEDLKHVWPSAVALAVVTGAALLLVRSYPDPFPLRWTLVVAAAVVASTVLVSFQLPDHIPVGRASWHIGANTWLLFFLTLRQRPWMAWLTFSCMAAVTGWWAVTNGRGVGYAIGLLDTQAAILLVATLFGVSLRRTARAINDYEGRVEAGAAEAAAAGTAEAIRERRVAELREQAVPLLERLAASATLPTDAERREYRAAEALLRDGVRGRALLTPAVARAATGARERGVEVTLLDDRGEALEPDLLEHVLHAAEAVLTAAHDGAVTVRLHPTGRPVAASVVATHDGRSTRQEFA